MLFLTTSELCNIRLSHKKVLPFLLSHAAEDMLVAKEAATTNPTGSAKRLSEVGEAPQPLIFSRKLPDSVRLSILGKLRRRVADRDACVCREWRGAVSAAKLLGMYNVTLSLALECRRQQFAPRQGNSSPLGRDTLGSWATEGHRMSLFRGWWTRWWGRRLSAPLPLTPTQW